jgi:hypothetical protein
MCCTVKMLSEFCWGAWEAKFNVAADVLHREDVV